MDAAIPEPLRRIYDLVAESPSQAADAAFVDVLPRLDAPLRRLAMDHLINRGNIAALSALVGRYGGYDGDLRGLIIPRVHDLFEAARVAITSPLEETQLGAIELIRTSHDCRLAYLLGDAVTRHCPQTTAAATSTLRQLTNELLDRRRHLADVDARRKLRVDAQQLGEALARTLDTWQFHYRTDVLIAAMTLPDVLEGRLFDKASQARMHVGRALQGLLRSDSNPAVAPFVLRALGHADLRSAAAERLAAESDDEFVNGLLDEVWITTDPENARACAWIKGLPWLSDVALQPERIDARRAFAAARLVALSGIAQDEKLKTYRQWIGCASPALREASAWRICEMDSPGAAGALREAAASQDQTVVQIATLELFRRDPSRPFTAAPSARRLNDDDSCVWEADIDAYWDQFERIDHPDRVKSGRRLRSAIQDRFDRFLRARLTSGNADERHRALHMVRTLHLTAEFDKQVYALSHDHDERIRSLAVGMLTDVEGATALRILRSALNDPNQRVQANAVEVLGSMDVNAWRGELIEKLKSENNRVRANAVKALLGRRVRDAAVVLINMLQDASPAQRLSALWIVEQLALVALAPRVQQIAAADPDARVRQRAEKILSDPTFSAAIGREQAKTQAMPS